MSTLDLFGEDFVLLAGPSGDPWCAASARLREQGYPICAYRIGGGGDFGDEAGDWSSRAQIGESGAVVVRPDGITAWRTAHASENADADLLGVLSALLFVNPQSGDE